MRRNLVKKPMQLETTDPRDIAEVTFVGEREQGLYFTPRVRIPQAEVGAFIGDMAEARAAYRRR